MIFISTETIGRAVGDGTRCRGHREIRPGGRRANLLVQMPFPRPIAAPDGAPDGNQGTDLGRREDMNAKETAICFLCGMAGALALVVAQRLLG